MKDAYTAAELAAMALPGLPGSPQGFNKFAAREGWERRSQGSSQAWEYPVSTLPAPVRQAILTRLARQIAPAATNLPVAATRPPVPAPAPAATSADIGRLKTWQRRRMDARAALLAHADALLLTGCSARAALRTIVAQAAAGRLPAELARLIPLANARTGEDGGRLVSLRSLQRWQAERALAGVAALAPKAAPEAGIPAWADTFMRLRARPQKPGIVEVLEDYWPDGAEKPSYDQARRFLKRLDAISRNAGRMGPRALQQLKAYVARDISELWPGAVFIGDGHTYKQEVAHPIHGQPFRPEVTAILDVYTRRWVGWSAALAENTWSVADALRHAVTTSTCCAILYYDHGSGAENRTWDDDVVGLAARLQLTKLHSAPWSSQARGVIERFNASVLHKAARRRPTYIGQRMDDEARRHAYKVTRAEIKATGTSRLLTSWADFIADIDAAMAGYNNRPHSTLAKIIDPSTAKRRHMTPNEVWRKAMDEGWRPDPIPAEEARTMFRPALRRTVHRAIVELFGNQYHAPELEALHDEEVMVAYDIHDANSVIVSLLDGRFVCEAGWNAHRRAYLPVSYAEMAEQKRVAGKLARLENHRQTALAELGPQLVIDHQPAPSMTLSAAARAEAEAAFARLAAQPEILPPLAAAAAQMSAGRPMFRSDEDYVRWCLGHPDQVDADEAANLRKLIRSPSARQLLGFAGIDLSALDALIKTKGVKVA